VEALVGVDLDLVEGEVLFVVGPSGSGKSTLLHLLGALDRPSAGTLEIAGNDLSRLDDAAASRFRGETVGFVFQSHHLLAGLSALDNVLVPLVPHGITAADRERATELLDGLGLAARLDHRPGALSGGECQRVAIARALVRNPRLILADEPTGELDSANGARVMEVLRGFVGEGESRALVVVTHDRRLFQAGERILELEDGRVAAATAAGSP
jgi:putative ABC transport system ATP-binding protein